MFRTIWSGAVQPSLADLHAANVHAVFLQIYSCSSGVWLALCLEAAAVHTVAAHYDEQHYDAGNDNTYNDADELPLIGTAGGTCSHTIFTDTATLDTSAATLATSTAAAISLSLSWVALSVYH